MIGNVRLGWERANLTNALAYYVAKIYGGGPEREKKSSHRSVGTILLAGMQLKLGSQLVQRSAPTASSRIGRRLKKKNHRRATLKGVTLNIVAKISGFFLKKKDCLVSNNKNTMIFYIFGCSESLTYITSPILTKVFYYIDLF